MNSRVSLLGGFNAAFEKFHKGGGNGFWESDAAAKNHTGNIFGFVS